MLRQTLFPESLKLTYVSLRSRNNLETSSGYSLRTGVTHWDDVSPGSLRLETRGEAEFQAIDSMFGNWSIKMDTLFWENSRPALVSREMTSKKRAQKFHTGDAPTSFPGSSPIRPSLARALRKDG